METNDVGGDVTSRIVSITSNEPDNGSADGNTVNDAVITGDLTANLRAERSGKGTGRVYTITIESTDAAGNVVTSTTAVDVPKSQGRKSDKSVKSEKGKSDKSEKTVKGKSDKSEKSSKAQSEKSEKSNSKSKSKSKGRG